MKTFSTIFAYLELSSFKSLLLTINAFLIIAIYNYKIAIFHKNLIIKYKKKIVRISGVIWSYL